MKKLFLSFALLSLLGSACKKEMQVTNEMLAESSLKVTSTLPPILCFGNSWDYDHTFYPDWNYQDAGVASDMQPLVYNNKVYVPDYEDQEIRIFDGTTWQHLPSNVPIPTKTHNVSFTIGSKGYVGRVHGNNKEFYQYNFATNTWTRKTDCPFPAKYSRATFSIGTKGYVGCGLNVSDDIAYKDFWEYNSTTNTWARKADMPVGLYEMAFFAVGNKGYIVNGKRSSNLYSSALYEYDPASNSWATKASFPGEKRRESIAFAISGKAYTGGGRTMLDENLKDYFTYDPAANAWTRVGDMSLEFMKSTVYGFSINTRGYAVYRHTVSDNLYTVKYTPLICTDP